MVSTPNTQGLYGNAGATGAAQADPYVDPNQSRNMAQVGTDWQAYQDRVAAEKKAAEEKAAADKKAAEDAAAAAAKKKSSRNTLAAYMSASYPGAYGVRANYGSGSPQSGGNGSLSSGSSYTGINPMYRYGHG
jgi:colicin import membrane protein